MTILPAERGAIGYCDNNWGIVWIDEQAFMATVTVYQDVAAGSTTFLADNLTGFDDGQLPTAGGGGHWTIQNDFGYTFQQRRPGDGHSRQDGRRLPRDRTRPHVLHRQAASFLTAKR